MSLQKLSAGDGYTYLTRQVAAADDTHRGRGSLGEYYEQKGESPGVWLGAGLGSLAGELPVSVVTGVVSEEQMCALFGLGRHPNDRAIIRQMARDGATRRVQDSATKLGHAYHQYEPNAFHVALAAKYREFNTARGAPGDAAIPDTARSRICSELGREWFRTEHHREPLDAREFTGYLARVSRPAPMPVAGYDLTFSPVKSVSALWAIAPRELSATIAACHDEAVRDTIEWLEKHAAYTRRGADGVAQVDTTGLIAAAFTHRDSRAGDPDLHTHVAVSNKVCTPDGRWLSLDGRALYRNKVAASEHYNTRVEALLIERVGVVFAERGDAAEGRREVREIGGLPPELLRAWSSRRADIEAELANLARRFQEEHGRPATTIERTELAQQATLSTRDPKHEPRSEAEQRRTWQAEAAEVLRGADQVAALVRRVTGHAWAPAVVDVDRLAGTVIETVQASRATWQEHHVRAEAERVCRCLAAVPDFLVDQVTERALSPACSVLLTVPPSIDEPHQLRRRDGSSVYQVAGSRRYTSTAVLNAERIVLEGAACWNFCKIAPEAVDLALLEGVANGVPLSPDQADMVRQLATSGAHVQLALAPAGSGKTTTLRTLAAAWAAEGRTVVGLAPTAAAARVLREELGDSVAATDTLAKLVHALRTGTAVPDWVDAIGPGILLIVDEAGMAATLDLAAVVDYAGRRGASVRLVGDDRQLAALCAGGLLRDIERTQSAVTLAEVHRFTRADGSANRAEAAASLALRRGDPTGLGYYLDHGQIHVGDVTTTADQAFDAWAGDRAAELDTLLIASTNAQVRDLNLRAQAACLATASAPAERRVTLADGTTASAGDVIITRRNDRRLALSGTDFVANGDRWSVIKVRPDGGLNVQHSRSHRKVTLPADYVAEHVQLGYATTVHGAQGQTVDTSHTVLTATESRQLLYVAVTRGRRENHLYLDVTIPGEDAITTIEAQRPSTAVEMLTRMIERDDSTVSATTAQRQERDPVPLLRKACAEYLDALTVAGESVLGSAGMAAVATQAELAVPGISGWPAWRALQAQLQRVALNGDVPVQVLRDEAMLVRRDHSRDLAAVVANRIEFRDRGSGPLPWLPTVPRQIAEDDFWQRYFDRCAELIERHGTAIRAGASIWTEQSAPAWALPTLHTPDLTRDLALWRAAHEVGDTDLRPTGPPAPGVKDGYQQHRLDRRVSDAGAMPVKADARIAQLGETLHPGITTDPYWPALAQQLYVADREGMAAADLHRIATARPLPIDQPVAAWAYRLVDALCDRKPATSTTHETSRSTTGKDARSAPTIRRPYEPPPLASSTTPPDYARTFGSQPRPGPGR
ncbi:hypothetical protein BH10ACT8_BH10ACT8_07330 [soil metagenome]